MASKTIANAISAEGVAIIPNFLSPTLVSSLARELSKRKQQVTTLEALNLAIASDVTIGKRSL